MEVVDYQTKITLPIKNKVITLTCIMYTRLLYFNIQEILYFVAQKIICTRYLNIKLLYPGYKKT